MAGSSTNVRNSSWNLANILIYPAAFLAATPFFINKLGENVFGEWMLINSYVFIAVHLVGFGLPHSITAHVAEALGHHNTQKLHGYINASSRLLGRMTALTALAGFILLVLRPYGLPFFDDYTWKTLIAATFLISVKFPEVLYQSIFKGYEHYHKAAVFNMLNRLIALAVQIILVIKGYSLFAIFTGSLVVNTVMVLLQGIAVYMRLPGYKPVLFKGLPERKELYHFGFWTWLQTIIAIASYQMDRFLIAWFLGTATVTYYVLASTIANHLHMAFEAVVSWLLPKVSRLKAGLEDTRNYFHTIRAFSVGFSLLVILALYAVNEPLFVLWLGPDKYLKMIGFFKLFLVFEVFLILSIVPKLYLNAIRSLSFITMLELMFKSAIIVGMILLFSVQETAESLIWGQIIALIIFMPVEYFLVNRRTLKENAWKETLMTMLPSLMAMGAILAPTWIGMILFSALSIVFFGITYLRDKHFQFNLLTE